MLLRRIMSVVSCLTSCMQVIDHVDELDEGAILDRLDVLHKTERRTQAEVLQLAVQFAILHDEHTLDPGSPATWTAGKGDRATAVAGPRW